MHIAKRPKAVVLGLTTKMPFAGITFMAVQYLLGLHRLGFEVFYVEEHGKTPWSLMGEALDADGPSVAGAFIADMMERFGLERDHWAFWSKQAQDRRGLSDDALNAIFGSAALVLNLHGGTMPRGEHASGRRLVYVGTDPVEVEVGLFNGSRAIVDYLEPHCAFFTWAENYGSADCGVPVSDRFTFVPSRQPIVPDLWAPWRTPAAGVFTTVGNWRQPYRTVQLKGEVYHWSKHLEFMKFIDLPRRTGRPFELAMANVTAEDRHLLESNGWTVRDAWSLSFDVDRYREYIGASKGEFTVAKDQNVRLRSGWFSDRAASYLACGRPVVTQETGFSNVLPTDEGLFAFSSMDEIVAAVSAIDSDYARQSRAASAIAQEYFDYRCVLGAMLEHVDARTLGAVARRA
jgi:hypothetical protein